MEVAGVCHAVGAGAQKRSIKTIRRLAMLTARYASACTNLTGNRTSETALDMTGLPRCIRLKGISYMHHQGVMPDEWH